MWSHKLYFLTCPTKKNPRKALSIGSNISLKKSKFKVLKISDFDYENSDNCQQMKGSKVGYAKFDAESLTDDIRTIVMAVTFLTDNAR